MFEKDDESEALRAMLAKGLGEMDGADEGAEFEPLEEAEPEKALGYKEGLEAIHRAKVAPRAAPEDEEVEEQPDEADEAGEQPGNADAKSGEARAEEAGEQADDTPSDDQLLGFLNEIPEAHRERVKGLADHERQFNEILAPYQDALKARGETPMDALREISRLNHFATTDPLNYAAWYWKQVSKPESLGENLIKLGERLGVKLRVDEPDPEWDDDDKPAEQPQPQDDPERAMRIASFTAVVNALAEMKGQDGNPLYPHFRTDSPIHQAVRSDMTRRIDADIRAGKIQRPPQSVGDLARYYSESVKGMASMFAPPAQPQGAQPAPKRDKAAAAERARRAAAPVKQTRKPAAQGGRGVVSSSQPSVRDSLRAQLEANPGLMDGME